MNSAQGQAAPISADQIGTLTHITSPLWWVVVGVLSVIGIVLGIWALVGEVYVTVSGLGVVIPSNGVITSVPATGAGRVVSLSVKHGDQVRAGQELAKISQDRLKQALDSAQQELVALQSQRALQAKQSEDFLAQRKASAQAQIATLQAKLASLKDTAAFQAKVQADLEDELKRGFATRTQVEQARSDKISTELNISDTSTQIQGVRTQLEQDQANAEQQLFSQDQGILKARQQVEDTTQALSHAQAVTAPMDGRVASIATAVGKMVAEGNPIIVMEPVSKGVMVAAYYQIADGKQIQLGSRVRVKVGSIDSDVFGTASGVVSYVDDLPSTSESLKNTMENQTLVQQIEQAGAPLKVVVSLDEAPGKPGYVMMASGKPSPVMVTTGTTVTAQAIVQTSAPISYVIRLFN